MACISSVDRHVDDGSYLMALYCFYADALHQLNISDCNRSSVYFCCNTVAADLLYICHAVLIDLFAVGSFEAAADRM